MAIYRPVYKNLNINEISFEQLQKRIANLELKLVYEE